MGLKRYSYIKVKEGREVVFLENIGYPSGSFKDKVRSYCNGFLNSHGGVLYFGCSSKGCIYGEYISRKSEDDYRLAFDSVLRSFVPFVSVEKYRLSFLFIDDEKDLGIIEIKVSIGDLGEIYEDGLFNVFIIDCGNLVGPLYPQELKELILLKYKESVEGAEEAKKFFTPNITQAREQAKLTAQKRKLAPIAEEIEEKIPSSKVIKIKRSIQSSKAILDIDNLKKVESSQSNNVVKTIENVQSCEAYKTQSLNAVNSEKAKLITIKSPEKISVNDFKLQSIPSIKTSVSQLTKPISRFEHSQFATRKQISYSEDFF